MVDYAQVQIAGDTDCICGQSISVRYLQNLQNVRKVAYVFILLTIMVKEDILFFHQTTPLM